MARKLTDYFVREGKTMKAIFFLAAAMIGSVHSAAHAQDGNAPGLGEIVVTADRTNARYAQRERPVVGLLRPADSAVMQVAIVSDTREETVRKSEIYAVLLSALDHAASAGIELVSGDFELLPVTKANYKDLPMFSAGRIDTSQVRVMIKVKLTGSAAAAEQRLTTFIKSIAKSGRGEMTKNGGLTLTIVNPDQYRDAIVKLVAENARHYAAMFGPDYAVQVSGVDGQIAWSQVSGTEVFLYVPYRYTIVPK